MTWKERKIVFVYSKLCSIYDELNHVIGFFENDSENEDKELLEARKLCIDVYVAAEKAEAELNRLAARHTSDEDGD